MLDAAEPRSAVGQFFAKAPTRLRIEPEIGGVARPAMLLRPPVLRHAEHFPNVGGRRRDLRRMRGGEAGVALVDDLRARSRGCQGNHGRDQEISFARPTLRLVINQPFGVAERDGQYDVVCTVKGGGLSGQAGAVKHGIAQALTKYEPVLRAPVKAAGFLTRDPRAVERKKYGKAKARRSFQFSKR